MSTSTNIKPTPLRRRRTSSLSLTLVAALIAAIGSLLVAVERTGAEAQGEVWAWGFNGTGQLGDGTMTQRNTPVQVSGLSGVQAIAGGGVHSLALKDGGTRMGLGVEQHWPAGRRTTHAPAKYPCAGQRPLRRAGHRWWLSAQPGLERRWHCMGLGIQRRWPAGRRHHHPADTPLCRSAASPACRLSMGVFSTA